MREVIITRDLTWEWVESQVDKIGMWLNCQEPIAYVTGLPRGGLIPAILISHRYKINYISLADAKFYETKPIYQNQRVVDNVRLLRGLGSDQKHQQMVQDQYR